MKNNKIKVAHVVLSMGVGGIEKLLLDMCEKVDKTEFEFIVICLDFGGELLKDLSKLGVVYVVENRRGKIDFKLIYRLAKIFNDKNIDVVHSHNQASCFYSTFAALLSRRFSILITEHSRHNIQYSFTRRLEKTILSWLQRKWVVVSEELAELANKKDYVARRKIMVIKNGIKFDNYFSDFHKKCKSVTKKIIKIPASDKVIIMVARLVEIKNHVLILRAIQILCETYPAVSLVLVGDGECKTQLMEESIRLNIASKVYFLGVREDIPALLAISDVLVFCSYSEGLPLSLLEGCAAGVPVVITEKSNGARFIRNNENGIVTNGGAAELSVAIRQILTNEKSAKSMALIAQKEVLEKYSLSSTLEKYKNIYFELSGKSRS